MVRLGFAKCAKKELPGHTTSAAAQACPKFTPLSAELVEVREAWLSKKSGAPA
jgi:hypothetical protein